MLDLGAGAHSLTMNVIQNAAQSSGGACVSAEFRRRAGAGNNVLLFAAAFATGARVRRWRHVQR